MNRWLPYPLLALCLLFMWILLNGVSVGHLLIGSLIALGASQAMVVLKPTRSSFGHWKLIPLLILNVLADIMHSNIAVAGVVLRGTSKPRVSGFVVIPLELCDRTALAVLACIITSTPGTAWVEYQSANSRLLIHVLDLGDERQWVNLIKQRYEQPLMEIFA